MMIVDCESSYQVLTQSTGQITLPDRSSIRVTGRDHRRVLQNFCTNDIDKLAVGEGCEAFVLDVKGKTLNHAFFFVNSDSIEIDCPALSDNESISIVEHIEKYVVSERVDFEDLTDSRTTIFVTGPATVERLTAAIGIELPNKRLDHSLSNNFDIRFVDSFGPPGFALVHDASVTGDLQENLLKHDIQVCDAAALEILRIEYGMPRFAADISPKNLPQEICRNSQAISFDKGCYLGQETVARIDALGHVNRLLVGLKFDANSSPPIGLELHNQNKMVGSVTSTAWSIRLQTPLCLGFVRRGLHKPGTQFDSESGTASVVQLPLDSVD